MVAQETRRRPPQRRKRRNVWRERRRALREILWRDEPQDAANGHHPDPRPRWHHAAVLLAYAAITAIVTWPTVAHLGTQIPSDGGDALMNYWGYWWVREALFSGQNPYQTPLLYAPNGAPLYLHTLSPINGLISIPFQLFGMTFAYNMVVLLSFVLAAYCAFLLVSHVSGNRAAGFVGGVIFAFGSYHLTHLLGHTNLLTTAWIPLAVLCFLRAADASGRRRTLFTLATTGAFILLVLADWQYVIFAALLVAALAAWLAVARRAVAPLVVAAATMLLLGIVTSPLLLASAAEIRSGLVETPDPGVAKIYSADIMSFVLPPERHIIWGAWAKFHHKRLPAPPVEGDIFLGFIPLALAVWALVSERRRALRWWAIGLAFAILALGPILHWRGDWRWDGENGTLWSIPMPFAIVQAIPGLNFLRVPVRLALMVTLALAVVGGIAIANVARRWPALRRPRLSVPLVALLTAALIFEHLTIPFPTQATTEPAFYRQLAASPERGTIMEWPFSLKRAQSDYHQTIHGRPIMGGYVARRLDYPVRALPPFRGLPNQEGDIYAQPDNAANIGLWALYWSDVHWIVVYLDDPSLAPGDVEMLRDNYAAGPAIYEDATMVVFRPKPPAGTAGAVLGGVGGWGDLEKIGNTSTNMRWFATSAQMSLWHFGPTEGQYSLRFDAWSFNQPRRLEIWLDGQRLGEYRVSDVQPFDLPVTLTTGRHLIELRSLDPPTSPKAVGYADDDRQLAFSVSNVRLLLR